MPSGDVDPTNYSRWHNGGSSSTHAYIGKSTAGSVTVNLGSDLSSDKGYIGYEAEATGEVTVDGGGSTWTNNGSLYIEGKRLGIRRDAQAQFDFM